MTLFLESCKGIFPTTDLITYCQFLDLGSEIFHHYIFCNYGVKYPPPQMAVNVVWIQNTQENEEYCR
jgi:hypothetical protein